MKGYLATAVLLTTTLHSVNFQYVHSGQVSKKLASDVAYRYINVAECFSAVPFYVAGCSKYRF